MAADAAAAVAPASANGRLGPFAVSENRRSLDDEGSGGDGNCPRRVSRNPHYIAAKRKSAAEVLRETKPLYVRCESALEYERESRFDSHRRSTPLFPGLPSSLISLSLSTAMPFPSAIAATASPTTTNSSSPSFAQRHSVEATPALADRSAGRARSISASSRTGMRHAESTPSSCASAAINTCANIDVQLARTADGSNAPIAVRKSRSRLLQPPPGFRKSGSSTSSSSSQLQNKLRQLLYASDWSEDIFNNSHDNDDCTIANTCSSTAARSTESAAETKGRDRHSSHCKDNCGIDETTRGNNIRGRIKSGRAGKSLPDLTAGGATGAFFSSDVRNLAHRSAATPSTRPTTPILLTSSDGGATSGHTLISTNVRFQSCDQLRKELSLVLRDETQQKEMAKDDSVATVTVKNNESIAESESSVVGYGHTNGATRSDDRGNSMPSSPSVSTISCITPPPLYCDSSELLRSTRHRVSALTSRSKSDVASAIRNDGVGGRNSGSWSNVNNNKNDNYSTLKTIGGNQQPINTNAGAIVQLSDDVSSALNAFFDNLGLDSDQFGRLMAARSNASTPTYPDSNSDDSSVKSVSGGGGGGAGNGYTSGDASEPRGHFVSTAAVAAPAPESPSIVERNARIIKWLCNCRRAGESPG